MFSHTRDENEARGSVRLITCSQLLFVCLSPRKELHGVPSPCGLSYKVCVTVCLTGVPSFSDITDVSTIGQSSKTDRSRTPLFHVAKYGDDIISQKTAQSQRESNPQPSEQLRPMTIKTSAYTESATASYNRPRSVNF